MPRGRHRRPPAGPVPLVRAAFGAVVLAVAVLGGMPAAAPTGILPGTVPVLAAPAVFPSDRVDETAAVAVQAALDQLGLPYEWGGDGPAAGATGFDCSGLTHHAYAVAGIDLPRSAHSQFYAGPGVPGGEPLRPGDLVFYGVPERVHHVGLYLGDATMVNASTFGKPVRVSRYRWPGDDYLGATRPAATGAPGLVPPRPAPEPAPIPVPEEFLAPPAALPDGLRSEAAEPGRTVHTPPSPCTRRDLCTATTRSARPTGPPPLAAGPAAGPPSAALPPAAAPAAVPLLASAPLPAAAPPAPAPGPISDPDPAALSALRAPSAGRSPLTLVATRDRSATVPAPDRAGIVPVPLALLDGLAPGDPVEITAADITDEYLVRSVAEGPEPAAEGPALVAPTPDGRWVTVLLD